MKKFLHILLSIIGITVFSILIVLGYIYLTYTNWEKEFEKSINNEYIVSSESIKNVKLESKIVKFIISTSDTEFLQLEVQEFGAILFSVLDSYLGDDITLLKMYIEPDIGEWIVYLNLDYKGFSAWFSFNIKKDDMQTAQIYTTKIYIGPFSMNRYTNWVDMINKGIGETVVTLNENGFVGRYLENIELLETSVVLKGSRY